MPYQAAKLLKNLQQKNQTTTHIIFYHFTTWEIIYLVHPQNFSKN